MGRLEVHESADDASHDALQERIVPELRKDMEKLEVDLEKEQEHTRKERSEIFKTLDEHGQRIARMEGERRGD